MNPTPIVVPCHRVVYSDGRVGGYFGGVKEKIGILASEGVFVVNGKIADFEKILFGDFKPKL